MRSEEFQEKIAAKFALVERQEADLHDYQHAAIEFLWDNPFSALFMDTGLGKSISCLTLIDRLLTEDIGLRVLVVAPVRVAAQTWPNEIAEWQHVAWLNHTVIRAEDDDPEVVQAAQEAAVAFKGRPDYQVCQAAFKDAKFWATTEAEIEAANALPNLASVSGKAATAKKEELRRRRAAEPTSVHFINREALRWLVDLYSEWDVKKVNGKPKKVRRIVGWPYQTVILDESSGFQDYTTGRWKALMAVVAQGFVTRLHELTATPAANTYMGLFAQIYLLDRGARLGKNITAYRERYFTQNPKSRVYKLRPGAKEEISDKIADLCLVMKSADYLDEIEPLFLDRKIRMTDVEMKQYRRFEREFILTLEDGEEIEAITAASLSSKLLQLASGAVYNNAGETRLIHEHKIEDLRQLQEELGPENPLLVSYWYKSSLARLRKAFPEGRVMDASGKMFDGRNSPWAKGKIPLLFVHPASVGHGLNGQYGPGHDLYMFDACWSYELYYQLYRRLHRQGQLRQVRVHHPQMIGTNDELVFKRLGEKEDAQEVLFNRIRAMRRRLREQDMAMAA